VRGKAERADHAEEEGDREGEKGKVIITESLISGFETALLDRSKKVQIAKDARKSEFINFVADKHKL
jgi:hypothetical protein